jgi:hypothetical protein
VAAAKLLFAILIATAAAPAAADIIELRSTEAGQTPKAEATLAADAVAAVSAPPALPLFAGALGLLGWRLGRRRSR